MNEYWANYLENFKEVPVVDVFGVVTESGGGWGALENNKYPNEPDDIGLTGFSLDVWRIGEGEVQTTRVYVNAIISYKEFNSLMGFGGHLNSRSVIHFKAKVAPNESGFQQVLFVEWVGPTAHDGKLDELRRQLLEPVILNSPPLPSLRLSSYEGGWHGIIELDSWNDFYLQSDPRHRTKVFKGFPLAISSAPMPSERVGYRGVPPTPEQVTAYVYLTENDKTVRDAVLQAILDVYPQWQQEYGGEAEYMPDVTELEQFQSLLLLRDVAIGNDVKEDCAVVYFSFDPNWDIEHGMGAVIHKNSVLAVGDHDSIWDVWGTSDDDADESE